MAVGMTFTDPFAPQPFDPSTGSWYPSGGSLEGLLNELLREHPETTDIQILRGREVWIAHHKLNARSTWRVDDATFDGWLAAFGVEDAERFEHGEHGTLEHATTIGDHRLRITFRRQQGGAALNIRVLPQKPPGLNHHFFAANPIPQQLVEVAMNASAGLILFGGSTGSGKSTVQAALISEMNQKLPLHIMTLEDPVEFVHVSNKSLISQREIGVDTDSFTQGILTAKRSNPNVLLVGELRDRETIRAALSFAGEGHLVLATSHASSVVEALTSIVGSFPAEEEGQILQRLANSLRAVVVQQLVDNLDGKTVPVRELLLGTPKIASKISERQIRDITSILESNNTEDGFSFNRDLTRLVREGVLTLTAAAKTTRNPKGMAELLNINAAEVEELRRGYGG